MSLLTLSSSLKYIKGIGSVRTQVLSEMNIQTIGDLLYYFPRRHLDHTTVNTIRHVERDRYCTVVGNVQKIMVRKMGRKSIFEAVLYDGTGQLSLVWFHAIPIIKKMIQEGDRLAVTGKIGFYKGFQIIHPEWDKLNKDEDPLNTQAIIPLYPLTQEMKESGLEHRRLRKVISGILDSISEIEDHFPDWMLKKYSLFPLSQSLKEIHFPSHEEGLKQSVNRLKFDEHFFLQLLMVLRKASFEETASQPLGIKGDNVMSIYKNLNFTLTLTQKKVIKEICEDLNKSRAMNRLLQGDVGSGKTVVAVLASAVAVDSGAQCAIMAPTEILAVQHFDSFKRFAEKSSLSSELLIGKTPKKERTIILKKLRKNKINIIIGTHALIQKDVQFKSLGLVIVDEQHRFGVVQRGDLIAKGFNPHFLAMTATPIPRTLTITYHGDMECSILDEMPKHRKPAKTRVVQPMKLEKVYQYMKSEMDEGKQCIIVYPLVEETEKSDLKAAEEAFTDLSTGEFSNFSVGLLHGRMKKDKKFDIMGKFSKNEIHLLISTTVIEVGIDVPNATVMVVEHADRFGLTQLHQLRGRVGRGTEKSVCVLVQRKSTESGLKRLQIMEETNDGFKIADEDLLMRGPGAFFSSKQSGFLKYRIADLVRDKTIIRVARKAAFELVEKDPHLRKPKHKGVRSKFIQEYRSLLQDIKIN
tara:strand:- start:1124 stop:3205 length:2082 start_codon:yes stop_codon:yes gene_type:complete